MILPLSKLHLIIGLAALTILNSGCATMCGEGATLRRVCSDDAIWNADLPARQEEDRLALQKIAQDRADRERESDVRRREQANRARERQQEEEERKQNAKESIEKKYGAKFCAQQITTSRGFNREDLQSDCLYTLTNLTVLQAIQSGVLVRHQFSGKTFFVKTRKQHADEDQISMIATYSGTKKYLSTMGAEKTVISFNFLGDY